MAATAVLLLAVLFRAPFANGPAEWEWAYHGGGLDGWWPAAAAAAAILALAGVIVERGSLRGGALLLALLAWFFTLALVAAQPGSFGRVAASLASRHSFGYVYDAALAPPAGELLADYPAAARRLNQHARTHPPGALLAVRAMDALGRRLEHRAPGREPRVVTAAREALEEERRRARARRRPAPPVLPSPWTVALLALLLPGLSAAAAVPLVALARALGLAPAAGLAAAVLWALVPARSLFTPSLDQAMPLLAVAAAWLAARGGRVRWSAAGLCLAGACFVSYGYLVAVPVVAVIAVLASTGAAAPPSVPRWPALPWLAAGFALPWAALAGAAGYDPWSALTSALAEHHAIAVAGRSYLTWLAWNPYDFVLLLGPPVALLGLAAGRAGLPRAVAAPWAAWCGTLGLLWLAGSVRGEAGRIWLLFMPFACLFAAAALARREALRPATLAALAGLEAALAFALAASMTFVE